MTIISIEYHSTSRLTLKANSLLALILAAILCCPMVNGCARADFKIGIMQDEPDMASKFASLKAYLEHKELPTSFVATLNYPHAAQVFINGEINAMFAGSGIAGCLILKDIAFPVVRPLSKEGWSTYWAVIIAHKGKANFVNELQYLAGKKIIFCGMASSGEFYYRALTRGRQIKAITMNAASHSAAIDALAIGVADIAIVKNRVWDNMQKNNKYKDLVMVDQDRRENPDMTLMISKKSDQKLARKVKELLLALKDDPSAEAGNVRQTMGLTAFIQTDLVDFSATIELLRQAGVDENFDFSFPPWP